MLVNGGLDDRYTDVFDAYIFCLTKAPKFSRYIAREHTVFFVWRYLLLPIVSPVLVGLIGLDVKARH